MEITRVSRELLYSYRDSDCVERCCTVLNALRWERTMKAQLRSIIVILTREILKKGMKIVRKIFPRKFNKSFYKAKQKIVQNLIRDCVLKMLTQLEITSLL